MIDHRHKQIDRPLKFIFIPKSANPWYDVVRTGMGEAITEFGRAGIKIEANWDAPPSTDMTIHKQMLENALNRRPDGLAVACLASATDAQIINNAVKAGIPVITFDTDAPQSLRSAYIGHMNDYQDGADLGEFLATALNYTGKVGVLTGTLSAPNHAGRVNGFKAAIEKYKGMQIVFSAPDADDLQQAETLTEMALKNHPDIRGFFGCNATNPIGCARSVKKAGKERVVHIVGMDMLPETRQYLQDGVIDAVKIQQQGEIGYWSVHYLVALNQGHTVPKVHEIGATLVTRKNLVS